MFIYAASFIVTAAGSVFWPWVSDRYKRPKRVLILTCLGSAATFQLFLIMPLSKNIDMPVKVLLILVWSFIHSAVQPMLDAIIVNQLEIRDLGTESYGGVPFSDKLGKQRCFGSLGYAVVTLAVGRAVVKVDGSFAEVRRSYFPMFYIFGIATGLSLLTY